MRFLRLLKRYRLAVLALLVLGGIGNSLRFIGEWNNFGVVVTGQVFFGWGFYCYLADRIIYLAPGGAIEKDHSKELRFLVGVLAIGVYLLMFAFNGYGRAWW
ncbi:hypothetical protein QO209_31760 [Pseudomonas citronellolis]|uniref:hypothetical protein n=1 Tax=Pseudomonas citronellolis TaxID=53408 RepID=UPI0026486FDD|nr:hypothetical protein [Pseudomonas citronellolis]MDN6877040.1 hypothetical protein [Pseudomonas citronellolis]